MTFHAGPVPAGTSLYIPFTTYAGSTGASATCTGLAVTDVEIYKNGSTTQRASDAGIALLDTDGIDFDGITGLHGFSIDLSDNTDASFYAVGSWYWVVVSAITVDSQTVTFLAATFRIAPAETLTGHPKTDVGGWLGTSPATPTVNGVPEVDVTHLLGTAWLTPGTAGTPDINVKLISGDSVAADNLESACDNYSATRGLAGTALPNAAADAAGGLPISDAGGLDLDSKLANTNEVTAARMGALTDWINGGRLDLILDIIAADTTTDIPALISAAFASLQVNTRANLQVPIEIETPDASTQVYKIRLHLFDIEGNMEVPDSTPTIALTNAAGTNRASRLSVASNPISGGYEWDYTATAGDAEEQLCWLFTVVEGTKTRVYPATSYVVEESAYRFSSTDRATLNAAATQTSVNDLPTNAELTAALANGVNVIEVDGSTLGTHAIGKFPADVRDWAGLTPQLAVDAENSLPAVAVLHIHADIISADSVSAAAVTKIQSGLATGSALSTVGTNVSAIQTILTGITSLADWLRRAFRKDAGTAGMIAAEAEIDTGGTSTFTGTTDSLEAIRDASGGGGGGGGGGDATLANQELILAALASIESSLAATTVTVTGYASIDSDGVLQLKRAETATLTFTSDSADLVPDLSAGTTKIILGIKDTAGRVWLSLEGTVLVATGLQSVRFVLTPTLSLALIKGHHNFDVLAIYGYSTSLTPPYTSLKTFTSGRVTVTDVYLDPLEL